ncbi:MAG: MBL fold metallo-hydrolase [Phycisphaerae bacterium]|nr:MBL fold metallo-hydrolase [Phycisphaerae bacterium]
MRITVLGSGTSHGIPMIGCRCPVCTSRDPRNRRMRTSAAMDLGGQTLLVDTTPELRLQATTFGIERASAVCFTHSHADHIMGFDDLRRFAELGGQAIPVYASPATLARLQPTFAYALTDAGFGLYSIPVVEWHAWTGPVDLWNHRLTPVSLEHGVHLATGVRVDSPDGKALAWCPDCCGIPEESKPLLRGLDVLFLDGLRHKPHPTHFTVAEAIEAIRNLAPKRAYLVHMTHDLDHAATEAALPHLEQVPGGIRLAYDGLEVEV